MKIIIYDTKIDDAIKCHELIIGYLRKCELVYEIEIINQQEQFKFEIDDISKEVDLIYFGINEHFHADWELVHELRKRGYDREIVFYADNEKYAIRGYDVEILHYIVKNSTEKKKFESILNKAVERFLKRGEEQLIVQCAGVVRCINVRYIKYFEVNNRIITVYYGENDKFEFYSTMSKLSEQLRGKEFVRIHKSYLVNKLKIIKANKQEVVLKSGNDTPHTLPVGRKYAKEVVEYVQTQ